MQYRHVLSLTTKSNAGLVHCLKRFNHVSNQQSANPQHTFCSFMCKEDPIMRTFKILRNDFNNVSQTGQGFFLVSGGISAYCIAHTIGGVPLTIIGSSYAVYKYLKFTGRWDQWKRDVQNKMQ